MNGMLQVAPIVTYPLPTRIEVCHVLITYVSIVIEIMAFNDCNYVPLPFGLN